jgi:hypothetical protein
MSKYDYRGKTQHKRGQRTHCKSSIIVKSIETISHALRSNENRLVSHNVETQHNYSEITDIRAAIESVAPSVHCRSDGNHLSVTMSKHNTPYSEITDIRAAIELVAPSVHCRSDGNHLSVTMSKHNPLLKSPTYVLQSNQLRQACIVVRMEIICQSQCRSTTPSSEIGDIQAAIESVAPSVHCRLDGNHLSVTMSKHNTPSSQIGDIPLHRISCAKRALSFG